MIGLVLEVELVNVRFVEDERFAEQHIGFANFKCAQLSCFQFPVAGIEFSCFHFVCRQHRQVAQVERIPQHDAFDDAVVNIRFAEAGNRQANDFYVLTACLLDGFGCARDGRR